MAGPSHGSAESVNSNRGAHAWGGQGRALAWRESGGAGASLGRNKRAGPKVNSQIILFIQKTSIYSIKRDPSLAPKISNKI
jgi:hypothetical protein